MRVERSTLLTRTAPSMAAWMIAVAATLGPVAAWAHENHAPLPSKGVTVAGNNVLLSDQARKAIDLTTSKVTFGELHHTVEVNARVELPWNQQAMIASLVPGKIDQVLVRPGETVTTGQELARVVSMELESLQLALLRAASEVDLAERLVRQRRSLEADGVIAGKKLLEAETTLAQKTAELRIAEAKFRALGINGEVLGKLRAGGQPLRSVAIRSPIAGIITHADVRMGQVVKTTDHLYHVVDPSKVWIVGDVLESDVRYLDKGQPVGARFASHPSTQFDGVIDHVRLRMDRPARTQSVVIAVDNHDGLLRPGMFGSVEIAVRVAKDAFVCPTDAVIKSRTGTYLLVQRAPGKYESRSVKLGLTMGKQVEVLEGVFPGDQVVVTGAYLLASLLGNEHKARVSSAGLPAVAGSDDSAGRPVAVVDATVELPTNQQAFAGPRIEGRIRRVLVEPSQAVEAGQVLAEVESLELRTVQLDLLLCVSRLRLTKESLARLGQLGNDGVVPRRQVWELQNQEKMLLHEAASLKRRLSFFGLTDGEIAKLEQTDLTHKDSDVAVCAGVPIRAPAAGWIVGFHVVPGQIVHPEDRLFEIHDLSKVWVKGFVFERDANQVAVGQPARVTFSAFPDVEAVGTVIRIAPIMEEAERVLPVWVEVNNPDRLLKEGMFARVAVLSQAMNTAGTSPDTANLRPIEPRR
ncbi:MAG TPA: efflux RND transporter periplasmic adaptor subunit [Thermoguttaceae bacterium]|nr:efflux RND transporter periplasmic adaptor subunit [Thermoguttaceae bacterium]